MSMIDANRPRVRSAIAPTRDRSKPVFVAFHAAEIRLPEYYADLLLKGFDTFDMAKFLGVGEADVYNALSDRHAHAQHSPSAVSEGVNK